MNKIDALKAKTKADLELEKQLLPRLKFMGYLLAFFSVCSFSYAMLEQSGLILSPVYLAEEPREFTADLTYTVDKEAEEIMEVRLFNSYVVAIGFLGVATACFISVWKKRKSLQLQQSLIPQEIEETAETQE